MARKKGTSRCSISVKGVTYDRIKAYADANGGSISGFCEDVIEANLGPSTDEDRKKFDESEQKRIENQKAKDEEIPPAILFF